MPEDHRDLQGLDSETLPIEAAHWCCHVFSSADSQRRRGSDVGWWSHMHKRCL